MGEGEKETRRIRLVVDTNIVFSALITPGRTNRALLKARGKLYAPMELLEELKDKRGKIARLLGLDEDVVMDLIEAFADEVVSFVPLHEYIGTIPKARRIAGEFDEKDTPFVALAMHLQAPLWTGDHAILEYAARTGYRNYIAVDTEGVELLLRGESLDGVLERMRGKYLG